MKDHSVLFIADLRHGGVFSAMRSYMDQFLDLEWQVTLLSMNEYGPMRSSLPANVDVYQINLDNLYDDFLFGVESRRLNVGLKYYFKFLKKLHFGLARENRSTAYKKLHYGPSTLLTKDFDIVLDFLGYGNVTTVIGALARASYKATFVHDEDIACFVDAYQWLNYYDNIFCVSQSVKQKYISQYSEQKSKTDVLYNPLPVDRIRELATHTAITKRNNEIFEICSIGRLVEQKGFDIALQVAAELKNMKMNFHWTVFGDGDMHSALRHRINDLGLNQEFELYGAIDNPYPEIAKCDLYVQPSRHEGFGIAIEEAAILGIPIVCTDIPPFRELASAGVEMSVTDSVTSMTDSIVKYMQRPSQTGKDDLAKRNQAALNKHEMLGVQAAKTLIEYYDQKIQEK